MTHHDCFRALALPMRQDRARPIVAVLLAGVLAACGPDPKDPTTAENFPVVEPFAIDRAGSRVAVEFELPDAREDTRLRPVFVGFRAVKTPAKNDAEFKIAQRVMRYLDDEPMPVRLRIWRVADGAKLPVVLHELQSDVRARRYWYEPHPADRFVEHRGGSTDHVELAAIGHDQAGKTYYIHDIARIVPPKPGRYRLEAESLQTHPILHGLRYELLVSHYFEHGIE